MKELFRKRFALILALSLTVQIAAAQCVTWQVKPGTYDSITRIAQGMYKVTDSGHIGIIDSDGRAIVPAEHDSISPFYEGKALVFDNFSDDWRIAGVLHNGGRYVAFGTKYHLLKHPRTGNLWPVFFNEGLLCVMADNGKKGYINESGIEVLPCVYEAVSPFCEGYAVVRTADSFELIDTKGHSVLIETGVVAANISSMTNVYKDELLFWLGKDKVYRYNLKQRKATKMQTREDIRTRDYLGRSAVLSSTSRYVTYDTYKPGTMSDIEPMMKGSLYGYVYGSKTILPFQLEAASGFEDERAIVSHGGRTGMLKLAPQSDGFNVTAPHTPYKYRAGESVVIGLNVQMPQVWQGNQVSIDVKGSEFQQTFDVHGSQLNFPNYHPAQQKESFKVALHSDGLTLWQGSINVYFQKIYDKLRIHSINKSGTSADIEKKVHVSAQVHNPNTEDITTTISMSGGCQNGGATFHNISIKKTIPAKSSVTVSSYFTVEKVTMDAYVNIETTDGGQTNAMLKTVIGDMRPRQ